MVWDAFKRELIEHYAAMAALPAFKAHAWHQVNEFAQKFPSEFGDLPQLLVARMKKPEARDELRH